MSKIRILTDRKNNGFKNMAIDEAVFRTAIENKSEEITVRFYDWEPSCMSLGYFQSIEKKIDIKNCKKNNIDIVRRQTGGRAVLHDLELTYSVISSTKILGNTTLKAYLNISKALNKGLNNLGVESVIAPAKKAKRKGSAACFDSISAHEISVNGKKIVGSAQYRDTGYLLQHGSILINADVDLLFDCLKSKNKKVAKKVFNRVTTTINKEIQKDMSKKEVEKSMKKGLKKYFDYNLYEGNLMDEEIKKSKQLEKQKYSTKEWNYLK